jgi:hypothetical protein
VRPALRLHKREAFFGAKKISTAPAFPHVMLMHQRRGIYHDKETRLGMTGTIVANPSSSQTTARDTYLLVW